jgi:hypothetical protein
MKGLRIILIFTLVALLVAGSLGTVFAKGGPPADKPGNGPQVKGERQGFAGNVTDVVGGNVTIATVEKGSVIVALTNDTKYKIPSVMNKWSGYDEFITALGGNLIALEGRRVVALAGNVAGTWEVLKLMALPVPGTQPMHAHRVGNVTAAPPANGTSGNITIKDVHGVLHTFAVVGNETSSGNQTVYRPVEIGPGNITVGSFVTVVTTGKQKSVDLPVAKAIVLHDTNKPDD